jgi:hypothetical protein
MRYQKELSITGITIVILLMIFKPSVLGIVYNNVLGKLFLVACIVFLTLKHTIAGLLGVVFIAVIASNSVFEGIDGTAGSNGSDAAKPTPPPPDAAAADAETDNKEGGKKKEDKPVSQVDIASAALKALSAS